MLKSTVAARAARPPAGTHRRSRPGAVAERFGEDGPGQRLILALAMENTVALSAKRDQQRHMRLGRPAEGRERLREALRSRSLAGQSRPRQLSVVVGHTRDELGEQAVLGDATAVQGDPRDPGLGGDSLQGCAGVAVALERPSGASRRSRVEGGSAFAGMSADESWLQHECCYSVSLLYAPTGESN